MEAVDWFSYDQEDIAAFSKRMAYAGVKIITLSEGDVTHQVRRSRSFGHWVN
jgi:site-specific DNA recombinase